MLIFAGTVVKGLGRGFRAHGIPTANLDENALSSHGIDDAKNGIYAAMVTIGEDPRRYECVLSIGYNPHFGNAHRTAELWLLDYEGPDFYGAYLKAVAPIYLREERAFVSLDALITQIRQDATDAVDALRLFAAYYRVHYDEHL